MLDVLFLLFLRVSGLLFTAQVFGRNNLPNMAKIGMCAAITYLFFIDLVPVGYALAYESTLTFVLLAVKELVFGLILGYVTNLFLTLVYTAGQLIDMQMGFGMVNIMDVQNNISIPMIGNFLNIALLLIFFTANGHLHLIKILGSTVVRIPIGSVSFSAADFALVAAELFSKAFLLGVNIALPIIAAGLLTEIVLGVIIRGVPQLNVFSIGIPIKVFLGFAMLMVLLPIFGAFTSSIFNEMYIGLDNMFAALVG